jgi:AcrR family transcriptional regulator
MPRVKDESKIELIYKATLDLVLNTGYASLKMADVAKQAGLATGTLYIYFTNKEELINKLFLHLKEEKIRLMFQSHQASDSFFVTFKKLWLSYFSLSLKEFHKMLFIEQYAYSPLLTEQTIRKSDELMQPMIDLLQQAQKDDLVKSYEPELIFSHIMGSALEIVKLYQKKQSLPDQATIENCFEMAWSSIRK